MLRAVDPSEQGPAPVAAAGVAAVLNVRPSQLGSAAFRREHGVRYAYVSGSMYKGVASKELVVAMGRAGLLGFLGTGGLNAVEVESSIRFIQAQLAAGQPYGVNLLANVQDPTNEAANIQMFLTLGVRTVEASAFMQMTLALVHYRLSGLRRQADGSLHIQNRIIGKVSRPEVAEAFMRPAPQALVDKLVQAGYLTADEAELGRHIPMAHDICVEADSGGHTDQGVAWVLMPAMRRLRDDLQQEWGYAEPIRIGAAGGIGTPDAAAAAFMLGADFITTGSVNQCTVEARTSDAVKDLLQDINVQDTDYAPAGDMFEMGARVQVLKKGLLFAQRGNKLFELYQRHASLDEIDERTRAQIQEKFFKRSFDEVWAETRTHHARGDPARLAALDSNPKQKMALVFRWYFVHSTRLALAGSTEQKVDYQVHCGPALGAFNQWVKGTPLESWRARHVADIGERLMTGAAAVLSQRLAQLAGSVG